MKKLFQIGLLLLLYIAALAMVPPRGGPSYLDADIQIVSPADFAPVTIQDKPEVIAIVFGYNEANGSDLVALRQGDVEESPFNYLKLNSEGLYEGINTGRNLLYYAETCNRTNDYGSLGVNNRIDRRHRLDIGENLPRHGEMCRHI